jgi:hypothetical protein
VLVSVILLLTIFLSPIGLIAFLALRDARRTARRPVEANA